MKFVNHHQGCCGYVPTHADGSEWAHILTLEAGVVVYADTAAECLEELVPGYGDCPDEQARLTARTEHAAQAAASVQEQRIGAARGRGALPTSPAADDADDRALLALLRAPKTSALLLASPDEPGRQAPWVGPAPIVAVTTTYAPTGDTPPLQGDIVWLDPSSEQGYLRSLAAAGAHDYWAAPTTG